MTAWFVTSCEKETKVSSSETALQSSNSNPKNECRLVFATITDPTVISDFRFHYNDKGLADIWDITNYGLFTQEYDAGGKLKKSVHTVDGEVIFTVHFFYTGNGTKVVKEIYYFGAGTDIMDEAYYTYNAQGKLIKFESFINDYVAIAKYSQEGNLLSSELFFGGSPFYSAFWTYNQPYKNPYLAVPGIDHAFPYYTPADLFSSKGQFASLKQLAYDENGNPTVLFEYDPSKTVVQAGPHNYPASATYFDLLSKTCFPYTYEYENCGPGNDNSNSRIAPPSSPGVSKLNPLMLLKRDPSKSLKEQVKELRQQLKNIKR